MESNTIKAKQYTDDKAEKMTKAVIKGKREK
jgi:hypothetical protein